jgi:DNA-binding transcriptional regulator YdaS (Cro superfamily)
MSQDASSPLSRAITEAGSQAALAAKIGVSQQLVSYWVREARKGVPAEYAVKIAAVTSVPKEELRPDVFGGAA